MTGQYTINEADVYTTYGLIFEPGTLDVLLQPARRKESYTYSWRDENGSDRDVEETFLESRNLALPVMLHAATMAEWKTKYNALMAFISAGDYFILESVITELSWKLLYDSVSSFNFAQLKEDGYWLAKFTLNLIDDFPTQPEVEE